MGSKGIQGQLWGKRPKDWANIQEQTGNAGYLYVLDYLKVNNRYSMLDVGCGSGLFSDLAYHAGAKVTGIDASEPLIALARERNRAVTFLTGEMEELPFANDSFDIVCGFNSFQYAANVKNALTEAKRVLKPGGMLIAMIWGNKEDCEAASYLKAVGSLMPPPPPGAPGPFALSENQLLENTLQTVGFKILESSDIDSIWDYPTTEVALKGLIAAGPVARAVDHSGFDKVYETISTAIQPYIKANGHVVYHNKFRIIITAN